MKALELEQAICAKYDAAGYDYDKMDVAMTVTVAMTAKQRKDLAAMIKWYDESETPEGALASIHHDLIGIKLAHINPDSAHARTFSPWSNGYALKVSS